MKTVMQMIGEIELKKELIGMTEASKDYDDEYKEKKVSKLEKEVEKLEEAIMQLLKA